MSGYGCRLLSLPAEVRDDQEESETGFLRRFRYLARLRMHFWNRWRREHLTDLREHHRNKEECNNKVSVGEVVLVHEDNAKRSNWKMGKGGNRNPVDQGSVNPAQGRQRPTRAAALDSRWLTRAMINH